jgi:4-amino-4-deoxy-L-arabinose transferase-like glycosyltransferase
MLLVLCLSFAVRLLWAGVSPALPTSDAKYYTDAGLAIANGEGYLNRGKPTAYWPVGYPAFLGGIYAIFGYSVELVKVIHAALGAATVLLVFLVAGPVFGETTARIGSLMLALSLNNISYSAILFSEVPFTFLFYLSLFHLMLLRQGRRAPWVYLGAGIPLALACYIRPLPLLLPATMFAYDVWRSRRVWPALKDFVAVTVIMALVILPWTMRNWNLFGRVVLISTNGGVNFVMGFNPQADGRYQEVHSPRLDQADVDDALVEQMAYEEGKQFIKEHPGRAAALMVKKVFWLLYADWDGLYENFRKTTVPITNGTRYGLYLICEVYYLTAIGFGLFAFVRRRSISNAMGFLLLIVLYWIAVHMFYVGSPRYHFPVTPIIFMFAAWGVAGWLGMTERTTPGAGAPPAM